MSNALEQLQLNRRRGTRMTDEEATHKALTMGYELGMRLCKKHGDVRSQKFASLLHKEVTQYRMSKSVRRLIRKGANHARMDWRKSNIAPKD